MGSRRMMLGLVVFALTAVLLGGGNALAAPFGYVTDSFEDWVAIIDLETDTATTTVDVGKGPTGVAISPDGGTVYVANRGSDSVSVIDTGTNTVADTIQVPGKYPQGIAVSPDGKYIYTAFMDLETDSKSYLVEIAASTRVIERTVVLVDMEFGETYEVKTTPDGKYILTSDRFTNSVYIVDAATFGLVGTVAVGDGPRGLAVSSDSTRAYVANEGSGTVSVIDIPNRSKLKDIALETGLLPWGVAVSPDNTEIYVSCTDSNNVDSGLVSVIDTQNASTIKNVPVGTDPRGLEVNVAGSRLYVTNYWDNTVSVIDVETLTETDVISLAYLATAGGLQSIALGTGNLPPSAPVLVSPADGTVTSGTSVNFSWQKSSDPNYDTLTYKLYYSTDQNFTNTTPVTVTAFLSQHRVLLAGGGVLSLLLVGIPGAVHSRRKILALLMVCAFATLLATACGGGGGGGDSTAPTSNTPDGSDDPQGGEVVKTVTLSPGTTYYWKVVADDGNGGQAESETWNFTTGN